MVRSMMCRATLPISFWGYALEIAAHILNLVPTKKVSKTPFEMWMGKRPYLGHIKIWGCEEINSVMSDSDESGVTYTEVSSPFEGLSDIGSPRADDHEYLELPWMPEDPYVEAALQAPPSPDYVPGLEEPEQAPPSPDYSPDYVPESDLEADPEEDDDEDPKEDPVDYPADGGDDGDDEDEPSEEDEDDDVDIEADEYEEQNGLENVLKIIESMSKVRQIQETSYLVENEYKALPPEVSSEVAELNDMVGALILDWKEPTQLPPPVCVPSRCGISTKLYSGYRPRWSQIKIRPPGFPLHSTNPHANNFERLSQANRCSVKKHAKPRNSLSILHNPQMANLTDMLSKFVTTNTASTSGSGTLPGNTVTNPKEDLKGITTRSGVTIQGPKAVNHDTRGDKGTRMCTSRLITEAPKDVQPPVFKIQSRNPNPEPNVSPVDTPIPKASIPFPSRRNDENRREKANEQIEKFYEIFKDMNFEISFLDALTLMPKFASTLKALIGNKEKLSEMAKN
ncbi:hypothetical protein Tco_0704597 [Tanacetum coccineum]|uniref:Reverse transcriptase domain-containing protein n=1 Tax=Tanacetum coccineum TaxID=301880 RepID=A0ABQ4Y2F9_9ASTR